MNWWIDFFFLLDALGQRRGLLWTKKCKCGWTSWSSTSDRWSTDCAVKRIDASRSKPKSCDCATQTRDSRANLKRPLNSWSDSPTGSFRPSNVLDYSSSLWIYLIFNSIEISFFFLFFYVLFTRPYKRKNNDSLLLRPYSYYTKVFVCFFVFCLEFSVHFFFPFRECVQSNWNYFQYFIDIFFISLYSASVIQFDFIIVDVLCLATKKNNREFNEKTTPYVNNHFF